MTLTERELQMKYLILEDSYRKLEERVAKLEVDLALKDMLGMGEKLKNTSISLFLLRKDRERLASDLGLSTSDYMSAKSLGESALESLIYENKDVLNELKMSLSASESLEHIEYKDIDSKKEDEKVIISEFDSDEKFGSSQEVNTYNNKNNESVSSTTFTPMSLDLHEETQNKEFKDSNEKEISSEPLNIAPVETKKTTRRGRKSKVEKELEEKQKIESNEKEKIEGEADEKTKSKEPVLGEDFEDLDAAWSMWN